MKIKKNIGYFFILCLYICCFSCENNDIIYNPETLIVASKKVDCIGVDLQKCFLVKQKGTENWQFIYDGIEGFEYENGFEYEIVVSKRELENPPQDASSIKYTLVEIISKIKKTSENLPN